MGHRKVKTSLDWATRSQVRWEGGGGRRFDEWTPPRRATDAVHRLNVGGPAVSSAHACARWEAGLRYSRAYCESNTSRRKESNLDETRVLLPESFWRSRWDDSACVLHISTEQKRCTHRPSLLPMVEPMRTRDGGDNRLAFWFNRTHARTCSNLFN